MNILRSVAVSALLLASSIGATYAEAPLPAGKPAGTQNAALLAGGGLFVLIGFGAVIAAAVAIASSDNNKGLNTPTTSSTSTTGTSA